MKKKFFKVKKGNKKTKIATWSDNQNSEGEEEERANHCLMTKGDLEEEENENSKEVTIKHLLTFTKEYLVQGLSNCVRYEQEHLSKIKSLRKIIKVLKKKMRIYRTLVIVYTRRLKTLNSKNLIYKTSAITLTSLF